MDAASFTAIRLVAGAVLLLLVCSALPASDASLPHGSWASGLLLFLYAVGFSFAYLRLGIGTGALVLFGSVQATMILPAILSGERPHRREWAGLAIALAGLVVLVFPGLQAPSPLGSLLMGVAGVSWGVYSLRGRGESDPIRATTINFLRAVPLAIAVVVLGIRAVHASPAGVALAIVSGALTSGLGYVVWYAALRRLSATRAATVQLAVPVFAAAGGVLLLSETITLRMVVSAVLILGGVGLAISCGRNYHNIK